MVPIQKDTTSGWSVQLLACSTQLTALFFHGFCPAKAGLLAVSAGKAAGGRAVRLPAGFSEWGLSSNGPVPVLSGLGEGFDVIECPVNLILGQGVVGQFTVQIGLIGRHVH